jgi:hypothetical protein
MTQILILHISHVCLQASAKSYLGLVQLYVLVGFTPFSLQLLLFCVSISLEPLLCLLPMLSYALLYACGLVCMSEMAW